MHVTFVAVRTLYNDYDGEILLCTLEKNFQDRFFSKIYYRDCLYLCSVFIFRCVIFCMGVYYVSGSPLCFL